MWSCHLLCVSHNLGRFAYSSIREHQVFLEFSSTVAKPECTHVALFRKRGADDNFQNVATILLFLSLPPCEVLIVVSRAQRAILDTFFYDDLRDMKSIEFQPERLWVSPHEL